jgi:hypothetical protein
MAQFFSVIFYKKEINMKNEEKGTVSASAILKETYFLIVADGDANSHGVNGGISPLSDCPSPPCLGQGGGGKGLGGWYPRKAMTLAEAEAALQVLKATVDPTTGRGGHGIIVKLRY